LQTLAIDMSTTEKLAPLVPDGILKIAASGIQTREDVDRLKECCDGFLIGSALMTQPNPDLLTEKLETLLQ
jgi:indole-3-glycerol phosphate synthase